MTTANNLIVLVTGGAGFIGSHAVLALRDAGWPVVVLDDLSTGSTAVVPPGVPLIRGDVGDAALLETTLREQSIGAIMHFAGSIIVPESVADPLRYYDNNTCKSRTLIAAAVAAGVPHMLFSSTAAVYGVPEHDRPITERDRTAPINPYGRSKLMTEHMLDDAAGAHPFNYAALRYFNVAGADPAGRSGQNSPNATHLIRVALDAAAGRREAIDVFGNDYPTRDGTGVRDYIHVSDLALAHVLALSHLITHPAESLTLNCGYGRGYSVLEVLDAVERVTGIRPRRRFVPRRQGDSAIAVADNGAIVAKLGWLPELDDLDTMIHHSFAWDQR